MSTSQFIKAFRMLLLPVFAYCSGTLAFATLTKGDAASLAYSAQHWFNAAEVMATLVFAAVGAKAADTVLPKKLIGIGRLLVVFSASFITANGGGTVRDLLLYQIPFWLENPLYIVWPFIVALFALFVEFRPKPMATSLLNGMDLIGTGVFVCLGVHLARDTLGGVGHQAFLFLAIFVAVLTAVGGGFIRDLVLLRVKASVLSNPIALISAFAAGIYAIAVIWADAEQGHCVHPYWVLSPLVVFVLASINFPRQR